MIQEERLKPMIKMSMFDKNDSKTCKPMTQYARKDYVAMQLLGSFVTGSIAFAILCVMWGMYDMQELMQMLNGAYIVELLSGIVIWYGIFMVLYLTVTYIVYQVRYSSKRKQVKEYYKNLKDINNVYEREEKLKSPTQEEWE